MYGLTYQIAAEQLRDIDPGYRLIVAHPNYIQQHLVFSELMDDESSVYLRLDGRNLTQAQMEQQLEAALQAQQAVDRVGQIRQMVLDECDCAHPDALHAFIGGLLDQLENGRIVLFTRYPPHGLLSNPALREQMAFVPVDESLMLWDYARRQGTDKQVLLEVRALGNGHVLLDGREVEDWDGLLPRSLFFYLVDKGMTTRNDIFDTFWPTLSVREATNVFHVTKRKISEVLGTDLTVYWSGFYHIAPNIELSYDVVRFSELQQNSAVAPMAEATDLLQRAVSLYRNDFLIGLDMSWVEERRQELRQSYGEVLIGLAKAREQAGALEEALGLYVRAVNTNPQREDLALNTMKLYRELGLPADALRVYARLKTELQAKLGLDPAHHLQELAGELEQAAISQRTTPL